MDQWYLKIGRKFSGTKNTVLSSIPVIPYTSVVIEYQSVLPQHVGTVQHNREHSVRFSTYQCYLKVGTVLNLSLIHI